MVRHGQEWSDMVRGEVLFAGLGREGGGQIREMAGCLVNQRDTFSKALALN